MNKHNEPESKIETVLYWLGAACDYLNLRGIEWRVAGALYVPPENIPPWQVDRRNRRLKRPDCRWHRFRRRLESRRWECVRCTAYVDPRNKAYTFTKVPNRRDLNAAFKVSPLHSNNIVGVMVNEKGEMWEAPNCEAVPTQPKSFT